MDRLLAAMREEGPATPALRILLVDDDTALLQSLRRALRLARPDWEVLLAQRAQEALDRMRAQPFDLLVTDILMPGMDGMALLAQVRAEPRLMDITVIFMTGKDDRESLRAGMTEGADDYLTKPFTPGELVAAVAARLRRKGQAPPPSGADLGLRQQLERILTEREREVLGLIGRGLVTKEIASALGISPRTVDVHRANLMRKLDLHNASALAGLAVRSRLV